MRQQLNKIGFPQRWFLFCLEECSDAKMSELVMKMMTKQTSVCVCVCGGLCATVENESLGSFSDNTIIFIKKKKKSIG